MDQKTTPYQTHLDLGAKPCSYAGFALPEHYSESILAERTAVRQRAGAVRK